MAFVYGYRIIVLILGEPSLLTGEILISPSERNRLLANARVQPRNSGHWTL